MQLKHLLYFTNLIILALATPIAIPSDTAATASLLFLTSTTSLSSGFVTATVATTIIASNTIEASGKDALRILTSTSMASVTTPDFAAYYAIVPSSSSSFPTSTIPTMSQVSHPTPSSSTTSSPSNPGFIDNSNIPRFFSALHSARSHCSPKELDAVLGEYWPRIKYTTEDYLRFRHQAQQQGMNTSSEKYRLIKKPEVVIYEEAMTLQDAAYDSRWEVASQAEDDLKYDVQLLVNSRATVGQWMKRNSKTTNS